MSKPVLQPRGLYILAVFTLIVIVHCETSKPFGPPRQLSLSIACEQSRPCISAKWSPPLLPLNGVDLTTATVTIATEPSKVDADRHSTAITTTTTTQPDWTKLIAYRVRYRVHRPSAFVQANKLLVDEKHPIFRNTEKNVTRLTFTTTAGEHSEYDITVETVQ